MANERKTETIVRTHFEKFKDLVSIEEQASDNPKIDKLLKTASKKGSGKGKPEFLITFKANSDLLIVIECKADIIKHESATRDKYADFAVDGVLLYASYLAKDFDVLAIAVSGETEKELKISHFLHLKEDKKAVAIFGNRLLTANDYLSGYLQSPEKFRQDYHNLLVFAKQLNDKLHTHKILESQRSLLISCILIALEDDAFKTSYPKKTTPKSLSDFLTKTVAEKLEESNILGKKLENLNTQFSFIKTDTSLATKDKVLKELIDEIDENVNSFIKTHEYFDVLGQLYIEFLRYANSDKGLGIVLTPPHIIELFAELAQVNKNSIVYDNCTGTGGFLISAMKKMIEDAKGDSKKIAEIKKNQLLGVEYQSHIFALAVSNMYIHQDGKTNIINGSCFDEEVIEEVKAKNPTVGFLNPPYTTEKDELKFILNNLECLVDGGTCMAIVPMERALAKTGSAYEFKKQLLQKHTLKAVLSMPNELFNDSKANAVTCVMIFTAHKPHDEQVETYFGYYKDDGFIIKRKGRVNMQGDWQLRLDKWANYYKRGKEEAGFSVKKFVSAASEWCAEAYLETDYTVLAKLHFEKNIKNYLAFKLTMPTQNDKIIINPKIINNKFIELNTFEWQYFNYKQIFKVKKGKRLTKEDQETGYIPYVSSSSLNNGIDNYIDNGYTDENCLSFACYGSIGEVFYQKNPCWISDNCNAIYLKDREFNSEIALFISTVMQLEKIRFSYGMTAKKERLETFKIKLPAQNGQPDFEFMENYIKSLPYSSSI